MGARTNQPPNAWGAWTQARDRVHGLGQACLRDAQSLAAMDTEGIDLDAEVNDPGLARRVVPDDGGIATPLVLACWGRNAEAVRILLARGANPDRINRARGVSGRVATGRAALHELASGAVWEGPGKACDPGEEVAQAMLEGGAKADIEDSIGNTPLFWAGTAIARVLLDEGRALADHTNSLGMSALFVCDTPDKCRLLIQHGAAVNRADHFLGTPLMATVKRATAALAPDEAGGIIEALAEAGADIDAVDDVGRSALHFAATPDMVRLLVRVGASVDIEDVSGFTALDKARDTRVAAALLALGARTSSRMLPGTDDSVLTLVEAAATERRLQSEARGASVRPRPRA